MHWVEFGDITVPDKIVAALNPKKALILSPTPPKNSGYALDALIKYRASSTVDFLNSVLCNAKNDSLVNSLTYSLARLVDSERTSDPFILGLQKCVTQNLDRKDDVLRSWSFKLLLSMKSTDRKLFLTRGLSDSNRSVRADVADEIVELDGAIIGTVRSLHDAAKKGANDRKSYCYALKRLNFFASKRDCHKE